MDYRDRPRLMPDMAADSTDWSLFAEFCPEVLSPVEALVETAAALFI